MTCQWGKYCISTKTKLTASVIITENFIKDIYIPQTPNALASDAIVSTKSNVAFQSIATTSCWKENEGNEQSQITLDLKPASMITARMRLRILHLLHPAWMKSAMDRLDGLDKTIFDTFLQAKLSQMCIWTQVKGATAQFRLIDSETYGPCSVKTMGGYLHYISFVDDRKQSTTVKLLLDNKMDTCIEAYQHYQLKVNIWGCNITHFRCDHGRRKYYITLFWGLLAASGTAPECCPPYARQQNGVAERIICSITE